MKVELELDDQAKTFIIEKGYNPDFGAAPFVVQSQYIEDPLAEGLLAGEFAPASSRSPTRKGTTTSTSLGIHRQLEARMTPRGRRGPRPEYGLERET